MADFFAKGKKPINGYAEPANVKMFPISGTATATGVQYISIGDADVITNGVVNTNNIRGLVLNCFGQVQTPTIGGNKKSLFMNFSANMPSGTTFSYVGVIFYV